MNTKFNIQLCCYPHCLLYNANDDAYCEIQEEVDCYYGEEYPDFPVTYDDFDFDSERFENDFKEKFLSVYEDHVPGIVKTIQSITIDKPQYYRCFHRGDYAYADVELSEDWLDVMTAWIDEHLDWFSARIKEEWSSRDGFISLMDTDVDDWKKHLAEEDERYIGQMIWYMMLVEHQYIEQSFEDAYYDMCFYEYIGLNDEKGKEFALYMENREKGQDMTGQTEIEFPEA